MDWAKTTTRRDRKHLATYIRGLMVHCSAMVIPQLIHEDDKLDAMCMFKLLIYVPPSKCCDLYILYIFLLDLDIILSVMLTSVIMRTPGPSLYIKTVFQGVGIPIPMLKIRQSQDFNMGISLLVSWHFYNWDSPWCNLLWWWHTILKFLAFEAVLFMKCLIFYEHYRAAV